MEWCDMKKEKSEDVKWICLMHIASWLGVAFTVSLAIYLTVNPFCLLALLIPAFVSSSVPDKKDQQKGDGSEEENQGGQ